MDSDTSNRFYETLKQLTDGKTDENPDHIGCDTKKCAERLLESIETTLQSLYHMDTIDSCQCLTDIWST